MATGSDDNTPTTLLRYQWQIDGGEWNNADLSGRFTVKLQGGRHTVSVRAIDLNDNADQTPASVTFEVDAVLPKIRITRAPPESLRDWRFVVEFEAVDDRTPAKDLSVRVLFERTAQTFEDTDLTRLEDMKKGITRLKLYALGPGLHTLSLIAVDQAGNASAPAQLSLNAVASSSNPGDSPEVELSTSEPSGGGCCAIADPARSAEGAPSHALWLLGLSILGRRVRRRRRETRP